MACHSHRRRRVLAVDRRGRASGAACRSAAIWQARGRDRGPRQAAAARHPVAVLPGVLRRARLDDARRTARRSTPSAGCSTSSPGWSATGTPTPAGRGDGHRLAAGVPGRGDAVVQGAPGGHRPTRRRCPTRSSPQVADHRGRPRGARRRRASASTATRPTTSSAPSRPRDPGPVDVVTGDRDLFQLVDDSRAVRILYTARGVGRADVVDEAWVAAKYGIPGRAYADFATLRGDPSDGLPGVAGRRREDRGRADHEVRLAAGAARRRWTPATPAMPAGARTKLAAAARLPGGRAEGRRRGRATCRCRRTTTRIPADAARPGPAGRAVAALGAGQPAQPGAVGVHRGARRGLTGGQLVMPRAASSSDRLAA